MVTCANCFYSVTDFPLHLHRPGELIECPGCGHDMITGNRIHDEDISSKSESDHRKFLLQQLRTANKELSWWEDMLLQGNIIFTDDLKEE